MRRSRARRPCGSPAGEPAPIRSLIPDQSASPSTWYSATSALATTRIPWRRCKDVAALIPIEDLRLLEILEDQIDIEAARKALANQKNKVRVPLEQVKKRLGL